MSRERERERERERGNREDYRESLLCKKKKLIQKLNMFVFSLFSDCNSFCIVSLVLYGECSAGILFFLTLEIKRKKSSDDDSFVS